jgi:putative membrane protein (TIGR04086 family)
MKQKQGVDFMPSITNLSVKSASNEKLNILSLMKGLLASYIITIPVFMLLALILANTDFPQRLVSSAVVVTTVISVLTAGFVSTKGVRNKGWLNGGIVGLIYMVILYLISSLIYNDFTIDKYVITMTTIGIISGSIGGIVGINTRS